VRDEAGVESSGGGRHRGGGHRRRHHAGECGRLPGGILTVNVLTLDNTGVVGNTPNDCAC
jgi:hypothetical protein